MKKSIYFIGMLCLFMVSCNGNGNKTVVKEENKPILTIDQVNESWQTTPIKGVESVDIKDMVMAFQKQWPTQSVAALMEDLKLPEDQRQYITEYYPEFAFMSFAEGSDDADAEQMEARLW